MRVSIQEAPYLVVWRGIPAVTLRASASRWLIPLEVDAWRSGSYLRNRLQ